MVRLVLVLFFVVASAATRMDLNYPTWKVHNSNSSVSCKATVPGVVHTDLIGCGLISEPYEGFNDILQRWVAKENWTYSTSFSISAELLEHLNVRLVADGIDTVSSIRVNGHLVGSTDNMFLRYGFDVKSALVVGENTISVEIASAIETANARAAAYPYPVPPSGDFDPIISGEGSRQFLRKAQSHYGWDWGPCFATMGIYKPIWLEFRSSPVITGAFVVTTPDADPSFWTARVKLFVEAPVATNLSAHVLVAGQEGREAALVDGAGEVDVEVRVASPRLWWCNGLGEPALYDAVAVIVAPDGSKFVYEFRLGFRTIEWVQEAVGNNSGLSFYLKLNGVPGANWIPSDSFESRVSARSLRELLRDTAAANMNTLRVWGGGLYQRDEFYDIADELGVMIWQEFMFACAMYPTDSSFLSSVSVEVQQTIRRLGRHASVIVWSANNENEAALVQDWYHTRAQFDKYARDYVALYVGDMEAAVAAEDVSRPYFTSSPSNGAEEKSEGYLAKNPQSEFFGDVHHYNYVADCWDVRNYPKPRFASEYGFQSMPSEIAWNESSGGNALAYDSPLVMHRQHHGNGQAEMRAQAELHFDWPSTFGAQCAVTQISAATCIKFETEHYRRLRSAFDEAGRGGTMGTIYWQLNDIWQGPSWSSIEYGGRWKVLHYLARHFYAPLLISPVANGANVDVWVVSDLAHPSPLVATLRVVSWTRGVVADVPLQTPFPIPALASALVASVDVDAVLADAACTRTDCFLRFSALSASGLVNSNDYWLSDFRNATFQDPQLAIADVKKPLPHVFEISVKCKHPAAFVWLETPLRGVFDDNAFVALGDFVVTFVANDADDAAGVTAQDFAAALTVRSYFEFARG